MRNSTYVCSLRLACNRCEIHNAKMHRNCTRELRARPKYHSAIHFTNACESYQMRQHPGTTHTIWKPLPLIAIWVQRFRYSASSSSAMSAIVSTGTSTWLKHVWNSKSR